MSASLERVRTSISGAAGGLGKAIAQEFGARGARLFLMDMDGDELTRTAHALRGSGAEVDVFVGSVADGADVEAAFARMDVCYGGVDALVNNAGVSANKPTLKLSDDDWDRAMAVNVRGAFLCARAAGRRMVAQGYGSQVAISSIYGVVAAPERLPYCVSKAAVAMMAKALAVEWGAHGVRSNAIAPGYLHTKLTEDLVTRGRIDQAALERRTPLGSFIRFEQVTSMAAYLCSSAAERITGQVIAVDGGWTAYGYV